MASDFRLLSFKALETLEGMRILSVIGLAGRKKHGPEVQLLTLTIEKAVSLFGEKTTSYSTPKRRKHRSKSGKGGKLKAKRQSLFDFCTF